MRCAQSGDRMAYSALVGRYWQPVHGWLAGLCWDDHLAEDLTQEAFVQAWASLPRLAAPAAFRVWLFRIARNVWLATRRSPSPLAGAAHPEIPGSGPGPDIEAVEREGDGALLLAIARLPDSYREAYLLWTQERLPYTALAEILGTTEETARWRVCEARRRLVIELRPFLDALEP